MTDSRNSGERGAGAGTQLLARIIVAAICVGAEVALIIGGLNRGGDLGRQGGPFAIGAIVIVAAISVAVRSFQSS